MAEGPAHNIELEQALIGAVFINNQALDHIGNLIPEHFYETTHQRIFDACQVLYQAGKPANPLTIKDVLPADLKVVDLTISQYLARLAASATTVINAKDYAETIQHLWMIRESQGVLADLGHYQDRAVFPSDALHEAWLRLDTLRLGQPQRSIATETLGHSGTKFVERMCGIMSGAIDASGILTGLTDLDNVIGGLKAGDLVIAGGRPGTGKSTLAAVIARNVAKSGLGVGYLSLEMSRDQTMARILCDEAYDDGGTPVEYRDLLHPKRLSMPNAERIMAARERIDALPMMVDYSSHLTIGEIGAKFRGMALSLKRRFGAKMVLGVVDYLKFVQASDRYKGQRVNEVGEISRGLKQIAKDEGLAILLLVQLNRSVEQTEHKVPDLSSLRECVVGSTRVIDAATGHWRSIKSLIRGDRILALDQKTQKIKPFRVEAVWPTGRKAVFRLTTRTGRRLVATGNHPFLTPSGWMPLEKLKVGDDVATAMRLPEHGSGNVSPDLCRFLGYMVGDGSYQKSRSVGFISSDPATFADVVSIVASHFPSVTSTMKKQKGKCQETAFSCLGPTGRGRGPGGNPLREWLRSLGLVGQRDSTKRVPACCFENDEAAANFLAGYLSSDGCVKRKNKQAVWQIQFDSVSRGLVEDVQGLLLRFGIVGVINNGYMSKVATMPIYRLSLAPALHNLKRFAEVAPVIGRKGDLLAKLRCVPDVRTHASNIFTLPSALSYLLADLAPRRTLGSRKGPKTYIGWKYIGRRLGRNTCRDWAKKLKNPEFLKWADSDLLWEPIASIESVGTEEVFDISVPGAANFIGNGIVAHNSGDLEADADLVILLFRRAYYLQNDPKLTTDITLQSELMTCINTLMLIIAKQRSGPTGNVDVFCNMGAGAIRTLAKQEHFDLSNQ